MRNQDSDGAASSKELNKLHDEFAKELSDRLKEGETSTVAGKKVKRKASAAVLQVIRGFLRDNNVTCDANRPTRPVGELTKDLEEWNESEGDAPKFNN